jgi:multiple sugar transport system substrate-binding protein
MTYYSEYPRDSGRYWSVPLEGDAAGWAYRKDWFEDPVEKRAFRDKYGYPLDVPKTWDEMRDIAEFFFRPDENRYGIALYAFPGIETLAMGYENALFSFGGELGDYATCEVEGIVNSPEAVEALEAYKELYGFGPPHWGGSGNQHLENNRAITDGLVAMSMNFFAFLPVLTNPAINPHATATGFFANPQGPRGHRFAALGGQGISVVSYSTNKEEAMKFLEWIIRDDVQQKWAELGGLTTHSATLRSADYRNATPYNEAFYESMFMVKDFWSVPAYPELLDQLNKRIGPYLTGSGVSAREALDALAADWEATFANEGCI